MKVVILCGGRGTRLNEETEVVPKPMIEIGGMPILWHIMKIYSAYNHNEFIIPLGYKGHMIKEYIRNYLLHQNNVTIDLMSSKFTMHGRSCEPWKVTLVETGLNTMTGGRIKRIEQFVGNETFMLTYGDGLADIQIDKLIKFHESHGGAVTVTGVHPMSQFGIININKDSKVSGFMEKAKDENIWVNGGFFVCHPKIFNFINNDQSIFEREPLEKLAQEGEVYAYKHDGFWKCMDTIRDKSQLNELWNNNMASWKMW